MLSLLIDDGERVRISLLESHKFSSRFSATRMSFWLADFYRFSISRWRFTTREKKKILFQCQVRRDWLSFTCEAPLFSCNAQHRKFPRDLIRRCLITESMMKTNCAVFFDYGERLSSCSCTECCEKLCWCKDILHKHQRAVRSYSPLVVNVYKNKRREAWICCCCLVLIANEIRYQITRFILEKYHISIKNSLFSASFICDVIPFRVELLKRICILIYSCLFPWVQQSLFWFCSLSFSLKILNYMLCGVGSFDKDNFCCAPSMDYSFKLILEYFGFYGLFKLHDDKQEYHAEHIWGSRKLIKIFAWSQSQAFNGRSSKTHKRLNPFEEFKSE